MNASRTLDEHSGRATKQVNRVRCAAIIAFAGLVGASMPARAVDGCLVLLCFAAPSWGAIAQCVAPITQVLRDLARGKPFPTCGMAGAGNSAGNAWSSAPTFCPLQYTRVSYSDTG